VLKKYDVDLGFAPRGHKQIEGDGRTPEGSYFIDRRNPNSAYHLSLGISYPNAKDIAYAKSIGKSPGGEIFIHGGPVLLGDRSKPDWTAGCISVTNKEIEIMYAMVKNGTQIDILA
jgi:murein L,D-transpeptidase YafK